MQVPYIIVEESGDPLKSCNDARPEGSECPGGGAIRLIALILVSAASALAQSVPASISTIPQPSRGHPFFDASGNTYYLSGQPTAGAAQTQYGGGTCSIPGFGGGRFRCPVPMRLVIKVDPSGNQIWGTLLGGPTADNATALAIATNGNVAFTGSTGGQFPTTPGAAIGSSTSATAFAAMVSADGSKFFYSTYLPDSVAASSAIAVDTAGNAYIAGKTSAGHASIVKLSADGSTINYNVTLAGSGADAATAIAVDSAGNAFVAGQTTSPDFPVTAGAFQQQLKGSQNSFLVKLSPSGSVLTSTYFGGSGSDSPSSIAVDGAGNIDLVGSTSSLDLPTTQGTHATVRDRAPMEQFLAGRFRGAVRPGRHFVEVGELRDEFRSRLQPNWCDLRRRRQRTWGRPGWRYLHRRADRPRISGDTFGSRDLLPGLHQPHQRLPGSPELKRCAHRCNLSGEQRRRRCQLHWGIIAASRRYAC